MVENTKVEYRTSWDERCLECLCAFANTDGGRMYVGVGEDAGVVGVRDAAGLSAEISDGIRDALGIPADVRPQSEHGKEYVEISVCRSPRAVGYGGRVYLRRGKADRPVSDEDSARLLGGGSWDSVCVPGVLADELDGRALDIFRKGLESHGFVGGETGTDAEMLERTGLAGSGMLSRAAVLLFHQSPDDFFPGAYIDIAYYETVPFIKRRTEIRGPVALQAERAVKTVYDMFLKAYVTCEGGTCVERYPFPREAVFEAVLNAVEHRDYAVPSPVRIDVFEDRLHVCDICADVGSASGGGPRRANTLISCAMERAGISERGAGLEKMETACADWGIPAPETVAVPGSYSVRFSAPSRSKKSDDTARHTDGSPVSLDELIMIAMREEPGITPERVAEILGENPEDVGCRMSRMEETGAIRMTYNAGGAGGSFSERSGETGKRLSQAP